ncbi:MAG: amidase [Actinomycetota bacterium]|nr:amidase [Actinomycetota bacterium]
MPEGSPLTEPPQGAPGLTAEGLRDDLLAGRRLASTVIEEFLARAEYVQQAVNAFTLIDHTGARARAVESDARIRSGQPRPLEGLPFAVKDLTPVEGYPHTMGSLAMRDVVARVTDPAVQALIDAGAIPFARTNTAEFGCATVTDNLLYGETTNPWNTDFGAAGSSGGAAAALAAFATPLAQGTDSAGSLRMPAAACGVVGMKPSYGVVPVVAPAYLDSFGHNGPMARNVSDVRLMFEVMRGLDRSHAFGYETRQTKPVTSMAGLRVRVMTGMEGLNVDADVAANLATACRVLADAGADVQEVPFPWDFERLFAAVKNAFATTYMPLAKAARDSGADVTDLTRAFIESVLPVTKDGLHAVRAQAEMAELHASLAVHFTQADVLALPTLAMPAPIAHEHFIDRGPMVNGVEHADRWIVAFTVPFNLMSACPAISVPSGMAVSGIPTGLQLVGRPYEDDALLDIAQLAESALIAAGLTPSPATAEGSS